MGDRKVYHQPVKPGSKSIQLAATLVDSTLPLTFFFFHDPCLPHESSTQAILIKTFIFIITKYFPSLLFPFSPKQALRTCYSTERVSARQTVSTDRFVLDIHEQLFSGDNICLQEPGTRYRDDLRRHWSRHSCG